MVDPLLSVLVVASLVIAGLVVLAPGWGLADRYRAARATKERVLLEDALKHMYDCEYKRLSCSLQSIAGALTLSVDRAAVLVTRLERLGLLDSSAAALTLTPEGRSYALRVIRVHRLWEHYLAAETGLGETEWHAAAEREEHRLTADQVDALAARMGNPGFDPHGDPIPSVTGELPEPAGRPLADLAEGTVGRISHIEDEPETVYAQLVAVGLHPGMTLRVLEVTGQRMRIAVDDEECVLAPVLARSVTVVPADREPVREARRIPLSSIPQGKSVVVIGIARSVRGQQRRRLMDMGIVPGTEITPELVSIGGDPVAYRVRDTLVALREKQAEHIHVRMTG